MQRAKVIEELKTSLSIFIDKYNKLKVELEKERQYGIQVSLGMKSSQRLLKKGKSFGVLKITHFSSYFPKSRKKPEKPKSEIELKELKEKFEQFKNEKNQIENEWNLSLNKLKGELEEKQKLLTECQSELENEKK